MRNPHKHTTSVLSALVCATALVLGGSGMAAAQPHDIGETSVDSGIVGGTTGSNQGMTAQNHGIGEHGVAAAHPRFAANNVSTDSADSGGPLSDQGMRPRTGADRTRDGRIQYRSGDDLNRGNISVDSANPDKHPGASSNHGMKLED